MENLKKENEALKSYIDTLKYDRNVLMLQVKKNEWQIDNLKLQIEALELENESLHKKIEYLENN